MSATIGYRIVPVELTDDQMGMLRAWARGFGRKKVCAELFISTSTYQRRAERIYDKLGVGGSPVEAVAQCMRLGILE